MIPPFHKHAATLTLLIILSAGSPGCGADDAGADPAAQCENGQTWNQLLGVCQTQGRQGSDAGHSQKDSGIPPNDARGEGDSNNAADGFHSDALENDGGPNLPNCRDLDADGYFDVACGGRDCDDLNADVHPGAAEVCDEFDNNCDGELNDGLSCTFYAHSPTKLYRVDPFKKTATYLTDVPSLTDIDTHPDGTLYGITFTELYRFDASSNAWNLVGSLEINGTGSGDPNGLAINNDGVFFLTAGDRVYTVDPTSGRASSLGTFGSGLRSSGDCVVNKDNSLFMTSPTPGNLANMDSIVSISPSGQGFQIGSHLGFGDIYALTAAWGRVLGLSGAGELIEIDTGAGTATLMHTFDDIAWYGAASTPER